MSLPCLVCDAEVLGDLVEFRGEDLELVELARREGWDCWYTEGETYACPHCGFENEANVDDYHAAFVNYDAADVHTR